MNELLVVLCTFPDSETARQLGTELIERQLAACVNLVPGVESIFRWDGKLETAREVLGVFKTTPAAYPAFAAALARLHPYDTPEIIALEPAAAAAGYREWVQAAVRPGGGDGGDST